jgi:hypothetical protein
MKNVSVRFAESRDAQNILEWAKGHIGNESAFAYPAAKILASENGRQLQYALIHSVCMLEGLAPNPDATDLELVRGLKMMIDAIKVLALTSGMKEIIALTTAVDEKLERLMVKTGWEEMPFSAWRLRL